MKELSIEEKELLLEDLCSRLPFGIKCKDQYGEYIDINIYNAHLEQLIDQIVLGVVQMVLRPMSSMTREEYEELKKIDRYYGIAPLNEINDWEPGYKSINWLLKHNFDFRGLIEKELASYRSE